MADAGRVPRQYQDYIFRRATRGNVIACLPTGSGKTYIACMLMKHFASDIQPPFSGTGKRIFFLVPQKVLVQQQADEIRRTTPFSEDVTELTGDNDTDTWSADKWNRHLNEFKIFVMIHDIFKSLLAMGNVLPLEKICLIVFDEAHHAALKTKAKKTNHPYRLILEALSQKQSAGAPIRLLGLTASLINNRISENVLETYISDLEAAFLSAECVVVHSAEVIRYKTNAKVIVWLCDTGTGASGDALSAMCIRLSDLRNELRRRDYEFKNLKIRFPIDCEEASRVIDRLSKCLTEMSIWIARQLCSEYYEELRDNLDVYGNSFATYADLLRVLMTIVAEISEKLSQQLNGLTDEQQIVAISSPKLVRLLQLLENYSVCQNDFRGIIFVETRLEAKAIACWLRKAADLVPTLSYVRAEYLTGYSSRPGFVDKVSRLSRQHQQETMSQFRDGSVNLLVATSVLEEGLDVPECNCVIRYHLPNTYRSYQQSMGRARAEEAAFFLICAKGEEQSRLNNDLSDFEVLGETIAAKCKEDKERRDRNCGHVSRLTHDEDREMHAVLEAQKVVHPQTGAEITAGTAVSRVHEYLAQSSFGWVPRPENTFTPCASGYVCEVQLPLSSGISDPIRGYVMPCELHAKKSAYLTICKELMERDLLDRHLRPIPKRVFVDKIIERMQLQVPREPVAANGKVPGTRSRKQEYGMAHMDEDDSLSDGFFLFRINITDPSSQESGQGLGLLTRAELPPQVLTSITVFKKNRHVHVSVESVKRVTLSDSDLQSVQWFHRFVFCQMLDFGSCVDAAFDDRPALLIAPLCSQNGEIDLRYIAVLKWKEENRIPLIFDDDGFGIRRAETFSFNEDDYRGAVVRRWYRLSENENEAPVRELRSWFQSWKVDKIELCLEDILPDKKLSYSAYYQENYNLVAENSSQKLLKVTPGSRMARLTPNEQLRDKKSIYFVAEFCEICPMSASMWDKVSCLPAILHRLSQLRGAFEFRLFLAHSVRLDIDNEKCFSQLSFVSAPIVKNVVRHVPASDEKTNDEMGEMPASPTPKRELDQEESDDENDFSKKMFVGEEGDVADKHLDDHRFAKRLFNVIRRGTERRRKPVVYEPDEMFLGKTFVSSVSTSDRRLLLFQDRDSTELPQSRKAMDDLNAVLTSASGRNQQDYAVLLERQPPPRILLPDASTFRIVPSFDEQPACRSFPPGLHIEVFSAKSSHDVVDSERLETLGDAFLKFAVSSYLHVRAYDRSAGVAISADCLTEGHLTAIKGQLVSNYNLYRLSKSFGCAERMFVKQMDLNGWKVNWLPPGFVFLPDESSADCGNKRTQIISDKAVADTVEALIGAVLLKLGDVEAIKLLSWMGVPVVLEGGQVRHGQHWLPAVDPVRQGFLPTGEIDLQRRNFYERSNISRVETILNYSFKNKWYAICAITHSSCCDNWITGSYEKLEFLGDAVLDRLIATFCFHYKRSDGMRFDPGQMTDLRSALVNNAYLGCILIKFDLHKSIFLTAHEVKHQVDTCAENLRTCTDEQHLTIGSFVMVKAAETSGKSRLRPVEVPKILGDVLEALIGAIYLDSGRSLDAVWRVVNGLMQTELLAFVDDIPKNPIRRIYEDDPEHKFFDSKETDSNTFEVKLMFRGKEFAGAGRSHKFARLHAAMNALL